MKDSNSEIQKKLFEYFHLEQSDGSAAILGDFADKDFTHWLQMIHGFIQGILEEKLIGGVKAENYLTLTLYIGGQRVDVSIVKDGKKGPDELYKELLRAQEAGK